MTTLPMTMTMPDPGVAAEPPGIVPFGPPGLARAEVTERFGPRARASLPRVAQFIAACVAVSARYGSNDDPAIVTAPSDGTPLLVRPSLTATTTFAQLVDALEYEPATPEGLDARGLLQVAIVVDSPEPRWLNAVSLLFLIDTGAETFRLRHDASAYPEWFAAQLARHYAAALEMLLAAPGASVARFDLLADEEKRELVADCNPPEIAIASEDDLVTRFEARASERPNAVALTCDGRSMTFAQLDAIASTLAAAIALDHDVHEGDLVAILLDRTEWIVVTILAVLKTGAAWLPIDPAYPKARVEHMLRDSGAKLLLSERPFLGEYDGVDVHTLAERQWRSLPSPLSRSIDRLAYVIYTSGSTGVPKGVQITHRNVARLFESTDPQYRFNANDVWLLFHSPAFDFSVWELWGALLYGARLVIPGYVVSRDPQKVHALVRSEGVTVLNQTPSAFRQFDAVDRESRAPLALRWVIFAGEMLDPAALAGWFQRHGDESPRMINMYGITETTVHVTFRRIASGDVGSGSVIGPPIDGWRIHVRDRHGNLVPRGVAGEMYVGGDGVARGYLNRHELTAQRFLPDPFREGATLYRSGDLARRLAGDELEYLGRIDHQVKVRGFRIELGEIEHALLDHPAIGDAAVLPVDGDDGPELVAFLFGAPNVRTRELRQFLRRSLPAYMIPSRFVIVPERPLTSNGKLDRRVLLAAAAAKGDA